MYFELLVCALAAVPLVAGHGKIVQVIGDKGGNGTALGIQGAIVPGSGPNSLTEVDTTVFGSRRINTDQDIGSTEQGGNNQLAYITQTMAQSGEVLPQISGSGGSVQTTYHIVTSDGAGPVQALIDETGTGAWSTAKAVTVRTQVPGNRGFIAPPSRLGRGGRRHRLFQRDAANVNENFPLDLDLPDVQCTGSQAGKDNLCLIKVSNNNRNGPFGGVFFVQQAQQTQQTVDSSKTACSVESQRAFKA